MSEDTMPRLITANTLFYGDNLPILREYIPDESVDLVYLDPPFNSNRSYNVLFKDESGKAAEAQITAFDDTWHWGHQAEELYAELVTEVNGDVGQMIGALRGAIGENQMMAYLVMMAGRLVELHRVLKPTGSLYLHCDPTASHYLKIVLDTIFGAQNFRNEVIWRRTTSHSDARRCGSVHDVRLFYSKSEEYVWNRVLQPLSTEYVDQYYRYKDEDGRRFMSGDLTGAGDGPPRFFGEHGTIAPPQGRHWMYDQAGIDRVLKENRIFWTRNGVPRLKRYLDEAQGMPVTDIWDDIQPLRSWHQELLGYPTQKPLALLERIISASSNPDDLVLDPFCGCGTTIAAAQKLGRRWIGIDVTHLAINLQKYRLKDSHSLVAKKDYDVIGEPGDVGAARQLAEDDRFQFQAWATSLVGGRVQGGDGTAKSAKKGPDKGVDGIIPFLDDKKNAYQVILQVKSGKVGSRDVRDLLGTLEREKATIGVLITLEPPTKDMITEAVSAGFYKPTWWEACPRLQILTIEQLLHGAQVQMPPPHGAFKQAPKVQQDHGLQPQLGLGV